MKKNHLGEKVLVIGIILLVVGTGTFPSTGQSTQSKEMQGTFRDSPLPVEWNRTYPRPLGNSGGNCIQVTPDGGSVIAGFAGWGAWYSFYLLKVDLQGNEQWNRTFESGYTQANWVEVTNDNGYIITGKGCKWIEEEQEWVADIWVIKTDVNGYEEWNWTRLTLYPDYGTCVKQISDGGYIINDIANSNNNYNFSLLKLDAFGTLLWEKTYENKWGFSLVITPDDGFIISGLSEQALLLMKTDENGTMEWEQEFFHDIWPDCRGNDVHVTPDGGYIVGGSTSTYSTSDLLLLKTNESGVEQWHQTYGFSGTDWGTSVALLDNGDYILGGTHLGLQGVAPDRFWLIRTNCNGNVIWSQFYLPLYDARCYCIQQTLDDSVIASGAIDVSTGATCVILKLRNQTGNQPPYAPSNPNPSDGVTDVEVNTTLSWIDSDPNPQDVLAYDVYFGMNSTPPKLVSNQSDWTFDPGTLQYSTTYYWRIVVWDDPGASTVGPLWSFTTGGEENHPPNIPSSPSPADGYLGASIDVNLIWTGDDPDPGDTVTYDVYFGLENPPDIIHHNQTAMSYNPGTLEYSTMYYWRIVAWDLFGHTAVGPVWTFTTIQTPNQPPATPAITGPAEGKPNTAYIYTITGTDPDNADVVSAYVIWGDDTITDWTEFHASGESFTLTHSWAEKGEYLVRVKIKDNHGAESNWTILDVIMPRNLERINPFLLWFFERFNHAFPSLHHLFWYKNPIFSYL